MSIKLPLLIDALKSLDLEFERSVLSERSLVESVFFSAKTENKDIFLIN